MAIRRIFIAAMLAACCQTLQALAESPAGDSAQPGSAAAAVAPHRKTKAHHPPRHRVIHGRASYYSRRLAGKKMANGERLDLNSNTAASKTLPLGSSARITNLKNGQSTVVTIRDRGPYPPGRVMDVTPKVAADLDMKRDGTSRVKIEPLPAHP
jgi:rare lipoprotein A